MSARTYHRRRYHNWKYVEENIASVRHWRAVMEQDAYDYDHPEPIQRGEIPLRSSAGGWIPTAADIKKYKLDRQNL